MVTHRVQQMGLAQACSPVDEQRVVVRAGLFGDGHGGGVGKTVGGADDEVLEGVLGDEAGLAVLDGRVDG